MAGESKTANETRTESAESSTDNHGSPWATPTAWGHRGLEPGQTMKLISGHFPLVFLHRSFMTPNGLCSKNPLTGQLFGRWKALGKFLPSWILSEKASVALRCFKTNKVYWVQETGRGTPRLALWGAKRSVRLYCERQDEVTHWCDMSQ